MKFTFVFTMLFFLGIISMNAQIDTTYNIPKYPTGQEGLVRDLEAFSEMTEQEKEDLNGEELQFSLLISKQGAVKECFVKGPVGSDLKKRLEQAALQLYDFIPAERMGEAVASDYHTTLSFSDYFPQPILVRDLSNYQEKIGGWSLDYAGYMGNFNGAIADVYGLNGGFVVGVGVVFNDNLINFDFGIGGAKKRGDFSLPDDVITESNNAHFYY